ncbi:MAG TPA: hypothetical protein VE134_09585, partial [Methanomicrobiales archaeon]|nr:hypothetical protein [Methanomicrobiales archaeon]
METHPLFRRLDLWRIWLASDIASREEEPLPLQEIDDRVWTTLSGMLVTRWLEANSIAGGTPENPNSGHIPTIQEELNTIPFQDLDPSLLITAYERFLARKLHRESDGILVLRSTARVRRGKGSYYTPDAVVDYILQGTLSRMVQTLDLPQLSSLSVLDPACGG